MVESAGLLGILAVAVLVGAFVTWSNLFGGPILKPIDARARLTGRQAEFGSKLLIGATALSAIAAVLAVAGWIAR